MFLRKGFCKVVALLLSVAISIQVTPGVVGATDQVLSVEDCIARALANNAELAEEQLTINQKRLELVQANHAVRDQAAKAFSLFAKQTSLSTDIQYALKIAEATNKLNEAIQKSKQKEREIQYEMENLYRQGVRAQLNAQLSQARLAEAEQELAEAGTKLSFGLMEQDEVDKLRKRVEELTSENKVALLALKARKLALGEKINLDIEVGYAFSEPAFAYVPLTQEMMWKFVQHAERNDFDLYKDVEKRKLAEEKVNVTRRLYVKKFGASDMQIIESMYTSQDIDYEQFLANYDIALARIKKQWEGFFFIPIPLPMIIPVPKVILQGEYDGLRYFDDIKFSLPVSMLDLDKERLKEKETRKKLLAKIKQTYVDAKLAEETYAQALKKEAEAQRDVAQSKQKYTFGLLTKEEVEQFVEEAEKAAENARDSFFAYQAALGKLNFDSSGAVEPHYIAGVLPWEEIDDGLEPLNQAPEQGRAYTGSWKVEPLVEMMTSTFSVEVEPMLGATEYALFTSSGVQIGEKVPLKEQISHLNLVFTDLSKLKVVFYQGAEEIAEASFDGYGSAGALLIKSTEKGE